ncbi:MAG TPA: hypothetical protein VF599_09675 [Pyrinomonadaceae bacterium]|jgi:Na+-transporting NADH:ubiquinone oxidoreductase subunit NqrB
MEKDKFEQSQKVSPPSPQRETKGIINPRMLRNVAFGVITFSLVVCTVLCILAIWEFTKSDAWWRAIATFVVVSVAIGILTFVNEKLG